MSYILDALRKLEREQQGRSPVGDTSLGAPEPAPRRRLTWPLIGGAALLVNVGLIALLLWPARVPQVPVAKAAAPAPGAAATARRPPAASPAPAAPPPPVTAARPAVTAAPPPVAAAPPARVPADDVNPDEPAPVPPPAGEPKAAADPLRPAGPPRTARPSDPPSSLHGGAIARPSAPAGSAAHAHRPAVVPPSTPVGEPPERKSPATATAALTHGVPAGAPQLRLEVLVYSERAADRFVFINGRKFIEGQPVDEGVVLERIQPESAVLSYQGRRFLLRE